MITRDKKQSRSRRHARIRAKVRGTSARPRCAVYKSNKYVSAQLIDDEAERTIGSVTSRSVAPNAPGVEQARSVGTALAELAKKHKISEAVFDRGGFMYTGRIKALAEAARDAGLAL